MNSVSNNLESTAKIVSSFDIFMYVIAFLLFGVLLVILFILFMWIFGRDKKTDVRQVSDVIDSVKKSENEFQLRKQEIEESVREEKNKIEDKRLTDKELIDKDPLEYIRRNF